MIKTMGMILGLILCFSMAEAAEKAKRAPNDMPPGAVGMPMRPGSGIPPHPVGLPAPVDGSCRRAAGMAAAKDALDDNDNSEDCSVSALSVVKMNSSYNVTVTCGDNENETETKLYHVKTRLKSKKSDSCRAISVDLVKE